MSKGSKKALVPKLRFPEFKETGDWIRHPMGELFEFQANNSLSRDKLNYEYGVVRNIHYGDIHTKFQTLFSLRNEHVPFISDVEFSKKVRPESFCVEGDIIFADASEDLQDIGKCIEIIDLNGEKVLSGLHTILARPQRDKFQIGFCGYLFKSAAVRSQIQREAQGAKVLGISAKKLSKIELLFPKSKAEQKKIADCLSSLDDLICAQNEKITALKTYKKGLLQQLFPQEGETVPRLRFPEFRKDGEWVEKSINDISPVVTAGGTPSTSEPKYWGGGIRWMNSGELNLKRVHEVQGRITELGLNNSSTKIIPPKCILIGLAGQGKTRGTVAMNMVELCTNQSIAAIFPNELLFDSEFLYHNLDGRYDELRRLSAGDGGRGGLNLQIIKNLKIHLPKSKREQKKIADCLSSLDDLICSEESKLEYLKAHKKGLLQQLFPSLTEDADE